MEQAPQSKITQPPPSRAPKATVALITGMVIGGTVINLVGGTLVKVLNLPLFLDMIGTFMVSVALGPWWGSLSGIVTNVLLGLIKDPTWVPFALVQIGGALIAGFTAYAGWWRKWYTILVVGIAEDIWISLSGALIAVYVFGGFGGGVYDILTAGFLAFTKNLFASAFYWRIIVNIPDKLIGCYVAWLILLRLPTRFKVFYENWITSPKGAR
jgi:energy-coupling factor transport system substrate-specific component